MKKQSLIYIALSGMLLSSCGKNFLDEQMKSNYSPETALTDSLGFEAAIAGVHTLAREQYTGGQGQLANVQVGTDVAINGMAEASTIPYYDYRQLTPQDAAAQRWWSWSYRMINNSNLIIAGANKKEALLTNRYRGAITGEAKFFRAFAYNFLTTLFGDVPLQLEPLAAPKTNFVRTPVAAILQAAEQDLIAAIAVLPATVTQQGRITKGAALHLLAEVYLKMNKPDMAEKTAQELISSGVYQLVTGRYGVNKDKPGDAFADMFMDGNINRNQGNTEVIWAIQQQYGVNGGEASQEEYRRVWVPFYVQIKGMMASAEYGGRGIGRIRTSNWVAYGLYDDSDMRGSAYNIRRDYFYNDPNDPNFGKKVIPKPGDTAYYIYPCTTKWDYYNPADPFGGKGYKDRTIMRLGETWLLLAEAQFKQGKTGDAAASINVLRTRAHAPQITGADITLDFILDERARELFAEEPRRLTLMRTGKLVERVKQYNPESAGTIQAYHMLLPIPQTEIDLNKDGELKQNTGYNNK